MTLFKSLVFPLAACAVLAGAGAFTYVHAAELFADSKQAREEREAEVVGNAIEPGTLLNLYATLQLDIEAQIEQLITNPNEAKFLAIRNAEDAADIAEATADDAVRAADAEATETVQIADIEGERDDFLNELENRGEINQTLSNQTADLLFFGVDTAQELEEFLVSVYNQIVDPDVPAGYIADLPQNYQDLYVDLVFGPELPTPQDVNGTGS